MSKELATQIFNKHVISQEEKHGISHTEEERQEFIEYFSFAIDAMIDYAQQVNKEEESIDKGE